MENEAVYDLYGGLFKIDDDNTLSIAKDLKKRSTGFHPDKMVELLLDELKKSYIGQTVQLGQVVYEIESNNRVFNELNAFYQFLYFTSFYQFSRQYALNLSEQFVIAQHADVLERTTPIPRNVLNAKQPYADVHLLLLAHDKQQKEQEQDDMQFEQYVARQFRDLRGQVKRIERLGQLGYKANSISHSLLTWLALERQGVIQMSVTTDFDEFMSQWSADSGLVSDALKQIPEGIAKDKYERDQSLLNNQFRKG